MLEDLTIILPSYEHHEKVLRILNYYSNAKLTIIISDGSKSPLFDHNTGRIRDLNYFYIHNPGAETLTERIFRALDLINTTYFCFLDDDDILLQSGLNQSINFLKKNSSFHVTSGRVALYHRLQSYKEGIDHVLVRNWGHWSLPYYSDPRNSAEKILARMVQQVRTASFFYPVMRTIILRDPIKNAMKLKISNPDAIELIITGIIALSSVHNIENYPYWMRGTGSNVDKKLYSDVPLRTNWKFPEYEDEIKSASKFMANVTSKFHEISVNEDLFLNYFESHRILISNPPKTSDRLFLSPVKYFESELGRELQIDEINDLLYFESIARVFPDGSQKIFLTR